MKLRAYQRNGREHIGIEEGEELRELDTVNTLVDLMVKLEGVDTAEKARMFTNVEVYFPKKYVEQDDETEDIPTWNFFIGFKVKDVRHGDLGEIVAVDDSTMNVLFAIEKDGEELLLPAHEEFICKLDKKKRLLTVDVPDGLL